MLTRDPQTTVGPSLVPALQHVQAALGGDEAAFEGLVLLHLPRTFRIAVAILGSEADARDAVQETWVAAWRGLPSLHDAASFDAWLDQILVNACRMSLRKRARVREIPLANEIEVPSARPGPDHFGEREVLDRAFGNLSVEQRTILVLHHLERRPLTAIAEVLGVPVGTVKSRLHTARGALGRFLETEG